MELLAPAGTLDVFQTAVESGANAIYIGAPAANARALARPFTLEEIAAMTDYAHKRQVKLYVAMNSLIREEELPEIIRLLSVLEGIGVDALIIQDLGVYHLARRHFPSLRLHASTLMGAHNSLNVRQFAAMGFARVVLARELSIPEIAVAAASAPVETEVFVHGAMCFAYSGLCLFSSFLGGKSGLRGRCVQPCRRKYAWQGSGAKGGGYLFSMNDLQGIDLIKELHQAGVRSLKIEGRMRSRQYVGAVVRAYRLVLDAPGDAAAREEAARLLAMAMGRKTTSGYFLPRSDENLITPQYSGNIGLFLGKLARCGKGRGELALREPLMVGDRIRIHNEQSGDRDSLTVKEIRLCGNSVEAAKAGETVGLVVPEGARANDPVYKVDTLDSRQEAAKGAAISAKPYKGRIAKELERERIRRVVAQVCGGEQGRAPVVERTFAPRPDKRRLAPGYPRGARLGGEREKGEEPLPWWLRIDDFSILRQLPRHNRPARIVALLTRETARQLKRLPLAGDERRNLIWALPPVILESEVEFYRQTIADLLRQGFWEWQLSHIGQVRLLADAMQPAAPAAEAADGEPKPARGRKKGHERGGRQPRLILHGHYTLNVMNSEARKALSEAGLASVQVAIESDRGLVAEIGRQKGGGLGFTVYGFPPLFTARPAPSFFHYDQRLVSPKGEGFVLKRSFEQTVAVPVQPFSLLDRRDDLKACGIDYLVVDLTLNLFKRGDLALLWRRLEGGQHQERLSSFNYRGTLQ